MLKYFILSSLVFLSDQLTKALIIKNIFDTQYIRINPYFYLVHFKNEGAAFSFLSDAGGWQRYFLSIVATMASVFIIIMIKKHKDDFYTALGLSLLLGGALGNLYDRISLGYVTDFLYFHFNDYYWPAFNIADAAITIGVLIIIYDTMIKKSHSK
ncbi:signal peptidase II [Methylophilaceae bacterium]|jgi:signal peptidase II|nr:signal peptidase II [Methylophilaceae bacterium]|tara:strand:- start:3734 stop:4198 length:465 start_codon:yes stop_codon:yes gene_type:complete